MNTPNITDDADGDAMRRVIQSGSDILRPMVVDFHVAVPNEEAGRRVVVAATEKMFEAKLYCDEESVRWTCSCSRAMLLEYKALLRAQAQLDLLSTPFGGYADGWGTFGNI